MPLDPSIALQVQQPNPANMISGFLDLGSKDVALRKARATLAADIEQRKAESGRAVTDANVAAATAPDRIAQQAALTGQSQTAEKSAAFEFQKNQAETMFQALGGLVQNPAVVNGDTMGAIRAIMGAKEMAVKKGVPREVAESMFGKFAHQADADPKSLRQSIADSIQGNMAPQAQAAQNLVPAGMQQMPGGVDVRGNPTMQVRDQFGNLSQAPMQQQGGMQPPPGGAPRQPGPLQFPAGENPQTYKLLSDEREAARSTLTQAPTIHALNHEILSELKLATTGQYSNVIARGQSLAGMLGLSLTGNSDEERAASAYDLIDKYTTQAATRAAQGMGNDTATALNAQLKQNASVERNPTAIKKSILFNDAVLSGAEAYQGGLERSIQNNPQADIFVKRLFDQEWARNFDPVIMQIYNAKKTGDTEELKDLVKGLGSRAPEIMRKAQRLQELAQRGL